MLPSMFFLLFCITVIRANDQRSSDDRNSEAEKILSSLKTQVTSETGTSLFKSGELDLFKDSDVLMKYVKEQYKNLAYTLDDNSHDEKYLESLVKNFFLDFCVSYHSQFLTTYYEAVNRTKNKGSLTAVQLAAPVRQYYDYIMNLINAPLAAVQRMCSEHDTKHECQNKLYSEMSNEAGNCKDVWARVLIFEAVLYYYKDLLKHANQVTIEDLMKEFRNKAAGASDMNTHIFNNFVSKLNDNAYRDKLTSTLESRTDLYKVITKLQNDGKLNCLTRNI